MIIWIRYKDSGKVIEQRAHVISVNGTITTVRLLENDKEIDIEPLSIIGVEIDGAYTLTFKSVGYFNKNRHEYPN